MFRQRCPRCKSTRIQLGFNEPPLILKLCGIRELLCNNCALEFRRFIPLGKLKRSQSGEPETTRHRRRAPRFKARLPLRLAKILKERFGEKTVYGPELDGYTREISKIGLSIILSDKGAKASDFIGSKLGLWAWVELPGETIKMRIVPVMHEKIQSGQDAGHLLIGAHIRSISEENRASLHRYLESLQQSPIAAKLP